MKNIILLLFLSAGFYTSAQELTEIYRYDQYGTQSLFPVKIIEKNEYTDVQKVYSVSENGIINIFPDYILQPFYVAPESVKEVYNIDYFGNIGLFPEYRIMDIKEPVVQQPVNYFDYGYKD